LGWVKDGKCVSDLGTSPVTTLSFLESWTERTVRLLQILMGKCPLILSYEGSMLEWLRIAQMDMFYLPLQIFISLLTLLCT
jgi:hypothetical protein